METHNEPSLVSRVSVVIFPLSLALAWIASAFTQRINAPSIGSEFIGISLAIPLLLWGLMHQRLTRARIGLLAVLSIPVLLMLITSLLADSPGQALLGVGPNWQGWVLWASALGWFWVAVAAASGRDLARIVRVLVWLGSFTAIWALLEAAGALPAYQVRTGASAMAFFDSSLSMGQALVLTIAATVSSAVRKNLRPSGRLVYWLLAILQVSALLVSGSRAAAVGLVLAVAAYGVLEKPVDKRSRAIHFSSAAILVAFVIGFGAISAAWSGALGHQAYTRADQLLSGRFAIWNHVGERMGDRLLLGTGTEPFDSIITWNALADGRVAASVTYDQHSILLTWLMSTGFLGLLAFGIGAVVLGVHIARSASGPSATPSVRVLAAGIVALFVAMLSSWPEPIALLSVSLIVGCLVSNGSLRTRATDQQLSWRTPIVFFPAAGATIAALISLVAFVPTLNGRLTTAHANDYPQLVSRIEQALQSTHDYSYLTNELVLIERQGANAVPDGQAIEMLRSLATSYPAAADDRSEIPLLALEILYERSASMSLDEFWELSRFYASKGKEIEPENGVWDYSLARASYVSHRTDTQVRVQTALAEHPPPSAQLYLEHLP